MLTLLIIRQTTAHCFWILGPRIFQGTEQKSTIADGRARASLFPRPTVDKVELVLERNPAPNPTGSEWALPLELGASSPAGTRQGTLRKLHEACRYVHVSEARSPFLNICFSFFSFWGRGPLGCWVLAASQTFLLQSLPVLLWNPVLQRRHALLSKRNVAKGTY